MKNTAQHIFEAFEKLNVLIVGDVMIDRYINGKVTRISPEAPVPIVHLQKRENRLGGAANVALNIKAMGAQAYLCSVIGKDESAELLMDLMAKEGLTGKGILQSSRRVTTTKTRVIAEHQHLLRVDDEDVHDITPKEEQALMQMVKEILDTRHIDIILFQDYNKGVLTLNLIRQVLLESIKRDIPTAVDPKKNNFSAYCKVTLFKPNLKEVRESVPLEVAINRASLMRASEYLKIQLNNKITLITLSERGIFVDDGQRTELIPTLPRSIADVCGAGDTVFSVAALCVALEMEGGAMATLANLAGGQVCEKVGVVPVDKAKLMKEYQFYLAEKEEASL